MLQGMEQSLHRLVELSELALGMLTAPGAEAGNAAPATAAARSVGCSTGSENGTGEGVFDLSQEASFAALRWTSGAAPKHRFRATTTCWIRRRQFG